MTQAATRAHRQIENHKKIWLLQVQQQKESYILLAWQYAFRFFTELS
jgi:hypothetical protein